MWCSEKEAIDRGCERLVEVNFVLDNYLLENDST